MFATGPRAVGADDQDWFAVALEAGTTYRFDLEGSDTGSSSLRDPVLRGTFNWSGARIDDTWEDGGGEGYNAPHLDQNVLGPSYATVATASILGLSVGLFPRRPYGPVSARLSYLAQTWHSKIAIRDENRK